MAKTKEELTELKKEYEALSNKLKELSDDELEQVCAGTNIWDIAVKLKEKIESNIKNNSASIQEVIGDWKNKEHS